MNQRSDFKEAKQTCNRLYHEYTEITGSGNKPIFPEQQVRQRHNQQFEGLEQHAYRLDATGWRYYPSSTTHSFHLRHHDGNQAATCGQLGARIREKHHPGLNSFFFFFSCSEMSFRLPEIYLQAIDGRCKQHTNRAHVFLMHSFCTDFLSECTVAH